ncbi:hypothetical protein XELAEV_18008813mg [Xenopus laevis]|uniref:Uncharacterized protein n=1 Tax=Xenopus laevis TaxID=8355 RepID=A0A974DT93_XENLA|nr:hypothetical protein XELAEV_18008813mg [Xenopus laevis]
MQDRAPEGREAGGNAGGEAGDKAIGEAGESAEGEGEPREGGRRECWRGGRQESRGHTPRLAPYDPVLCSGAVLCNGT